MRPRLRRSLQRVLSAVERERAEILSVRSGDPIAARFASFGEGASIEHPVRHLGNTASVAIGARTVIRQGILFEALAPPGTVIISIGDDCHLSSNIRIVAVNGVVLEDGAAVAEGVFLADTIHDYRSVEGDAPPWTASLRLGDPLRVRKGAWIGTNCVVTGGIEIGERAIVAPCSVVTRDVPADSLVVGNPAYVQRVRRPDGSWQWLVDRDGQPVTDERR
jgi:acetyltransferase-like isoleucine patch superfamily enzyme